ncbi:type II toxin-antitoxin system RelE/ParE family toxin [Candidatus Acetothermia bacterium]|nr:type II toxin-antitoxin system RelE/ParE family toxin [Candidatus Acetothermia bacterium]
MAWEVDVYKEEDGSSPVECYLWSLPEKHLGKLLQIIEMLKERGPALPFPYSSQIEGKLRELRIQYGNTDYRILYYGNRARSFVLLHAFNKRTEKTPARDKQLALKRMKIDEQRFERRLRHEQKKK